MSTITSTTNPRLAYNTQVLEVEPGHLQVRSPTRAVRLRGRAEIMGHVAMVLRRLDGSVSIDSLLNCVPADCREQVGQVLLEAEQIGLVGEVPAELPEGLVDADRERFAGQSAYFANFPSRNWQDPMSLAGNQDPFARQALLRKSGVAVLGAGRFGTALFECLARMGVGRLRVADSASVADEDVHATLYPASAVGRSRVAALGAYAEAAFPYLEYSSTGGCDLTDSEQVAGVISGADLAVLCPDDYNPAVYQAVNRAALAQGVTWTSGRLSPTELQIGPTVIPWKTACFQCYELRRGANAYPHADYAATQAYLHQHPFTAGHLNFVPGASLVAMEVLKILTQFAGPPSFGHLVVINLLSFKSRIARILKVPRCPDCTKVDPDRVPLKTWMPRSLDDVK